MGKRKRTKRLFPKSFSASQVHVGKRPSPDMLALYNNSVKTTTGPKNSSEPVLENSFTRPVDNGVPGRWRCSECCRVFYTTISWEQHLKRIANGARGDHEPIFEPDLKKSHVDPEEGTTVVHKWIPTPKREVDIRLWQSKNRQGFQEWKWIRMVNNKGAVLYLGFNGAVWKFKREQPDGSTKYSVEYRSKEMAMFYWDNLKIMWIKSPCV